MEPTWINGPTNWTSAILQFWGSGLGNLSPLFESISQKWGVLGFPYNTSTEVHTFNYISMTPLSHVQSFWELMVYKVKVRWCIPKQPEYIHKVCLILIFTWIYEGKTISCLLLKGNPYFLQLSTQFALNTLRSRLSTPNNNSESSQWNEV